MFMRNGVHPIYADAKTKTERQDAIDD